MGRIEGIEYVFLLLGRLDNAALLLHLDHDVLHTVVERLLQTEVCLREW